MITKYKIFENVPLETYILVKNMRSEDSDLSFGIIKTLNHNANGDKVYYIYIYPEDFGYVSGTCRMIDTELYPDEYEDDDGNFWRFLFKSHNLKEVKKEYEIYIQAEKYNL